MFSIALVYVYNKIILFLLHCFVDSYHFCERVFDST